MQAILYGLIGGYITADTATAGNREWSDMLVLRMIFSSDELMKYQVPTGHETHKLDQPI